MGKARVQYVSYRETRDVWRNVDRRWRENAQSNGDKSRRTIELATLYEQRWQIEVNFRHLKTTMKMEILRVRTEWHQLL